MLASRLNPRLNPRLIQSLPTPFIPQMKPSVYVLNCGVQFCRYLGGLPNKKFLPELGF
jgi:hypothetical protein